MLRAPTKTLMNQAQQACLLRKDYPHLLPPAKGDSSGATHLGCRAGDTAQEHDRQPGSPRLMEITGTRRTEKVEKGPIAKVARFSLSRRADSVGTRPQPGGYMSIRPPETPSSGLGAMLTQTDFVSPITSAITRGRREKLISYSMTCRTASREGPINIFLG